MADRLKHAVLEALASAALQQRLAPPGVRLAGSTPAAMQALLGSGIKRWGEVIRRARIEPD